MDSRWLDFNEEDDYDYAAKRKAAKDAARKNKRGMGRRNKTRADYENGDDDDEVASESSEASPSSSSSSSSSADSVLSLSYFRPAASATTAKSDAENTPAPSRPSSGNNKKNEENFRRAKEMQMRLMQHQQPLPPPTIPFSDRGVTSTSGGEQSRRPPVAATKLTTSSSSSSLAVGGVKWTGSSMAKRYLEKYNFQGRLGASGQGIAAPVQVAARPEGAGLGAIEEVTTNLKENRENLKHLEKLRVEALEKRKRDEARREEEKKWESIWREEGEQKENDDVDSEGDDARTGGDNAAGERLATLLNATLEEGVLPRLANLISVAKAEEEVMEREIRDGELGEEKRRVKLTHVLDRVKSVDAKLAKLELAAQMWEAFSSTLLPSSSSSTTMTPAKSEPPSLEEWKRKLKRFVGEFRGTSSSREDEGEEVESVMTFTANFVVDLVRNLVNKSNKWEEDLDFACDFIEYCKSENLWGGWIASGGEEVVKRVKSQIEIALEKRIVSDCERWGLDSFERGGGGGLLLPDDPRVVSLQFLVLPFAPLLGDRLKSTVRRGPLKRLERLLKESENLEVVLNGQNARTFREKLINPWIDFVPESEILERVSRAVTIRYFTQVIPGRSTVSEIEMVTTSVRDVVRCWESGILTTEDVVVSLDFILSSASEGSLFGRGRAEEGGARRRATYTAIKRLIPVDLLRDEIIPRKSSSGRVDGTTTTGIRLRRRFDRWLDIIVAEEEVAPPSAATTKSGNKITTLIPDRFNSINDAFKYYKRRSPLEDQLQSSSSSASAGSLPSRMGLKETLERIAAKAGVPFYVDPNLVSSSLALFSAAGGTSGEATARRVYVLGTLRLAIVDGVPLFRAKEVREARREKNGEVSSSVEGEEWIPLSYEEMVDLL